MKKNFFIMLLFIFLFEIYCVQVFSMGKRSNTHNEVVIGMITPLSGDVADLGKEMLVSGQIMAEKINKTTQKFSFKIIPRDDQMSAAAAATAAKGLILQDNAKVIIPAGMSSVAKGQIEALKGKNIPVITPTATATDLTEDRDYVFRVIPTNGAQGKALANFALNQLKLKKAAILFQQDDYSKDLKEAFEKKYIEGGGKIDLIIGFESDETDFRTQLDLVKKSGTNLLICPAQHVQIARLLVRSRSLGIDIPICGGDTAYTEKLLTAAGNSAEGFYLTGPDIDIENPTPELSEFINIYYKKTGKKPGIYACYTYDTIGLIADIVNRKPKGTDQLISKLMSLDNYMGITGLIKFDKDGNVEKNYKIYKIENHEFKQIN